MNSFYIVNEFEQGIVLQFGRPMGDSKTNAGIYFKTPFIQNVVIFEKRILEWDGAATEIPTKGMKDKNKTSNNQSSFRLQIQKNSKCRGRNRKIP